MWIAKDHNEVHLLFDRYIQSSLKARTRRHRTSGKEVRYKVCDETKLTHTNLKQFLSHIETKQELTIYLASKAIDQLSVGEKQFAVTYNTMSTTNIEGLTIDLQLHDHEEADTLLILHSVEVAKRIPFCDCTVYSPDTDVFLLLIYYYQNLPMATKFRTGKGNALRDINVGSCFESLGPRRSSALLGFHTFTGCDQTGKFSGKSKSSCWKTFINCNDHVLDAFSSLGSSESLPSLDVLNSLEYFVVQLYGGNTRPTSIQTLPQLRWYMFSKYQTDATRLPPTMSALKYKIFRCHYVTKVLKSSHKPLQNLPDPCSFGWEMINESLKPIMTDNLPAPLAMIELSVCGCKSNCISNRCLCHKNNFPCTDMCKCKDCDNISANDISDHDNLMIDEFDEF